ncbi:hypothetical protein ACTNDG_02475 [Clostridium sp. HCP1S3_B4]|uniref:hypothetical protein n=1 Tax=unclassified Clostridium TaxID=2614128 RepID=UPI002A7CDB9A|nr:hypothetical protein [Clostridiales bacterium]MDY2729193.1 hypothetical protein [Clostridium sp.]
MKIIIKRIIMILMVIFTLFYTSYIVTSIKSQYKKNQNDILQEQNNKNKILSNNVKISLFKGDILEKQKSLSDLKKDLNLDDDLSEQKLGEALETLGYSLESETGSEYIYKRDVKDSAEANKYYIKEYDGYLAIFKCDEEGNLFIEDKDKDVYRNSIKFKDLPEGDKEMINNMQLVYNTKEEAQLDISDIIS